MLTTDTAWTPRNQICGTSTVAKLDVAHSRNTTDKFSTSRSMRPRFMAARKHMSSLARCRGLQQNEGHHRDARQQLRRPTLHVEEGELPERDHTGPHDHHVAHDAAFGLQPRQVQLEADVEFFAHERVAVEVEGPVRVAGVIEHTGDAAMQARRPKLPD
eukprot:scaffold1724_cov246-Pinguiococcus_pyrenoidosus.AAC.13